jgi:hypothetical protein
MSKGRLLYGYRGLDVQVNKGSAATLVRKRQRNEWLRARLALRRTSDLREVRLVLKRSDDAE